MPWKISSPQNFSCDSYPQRTASRALSRHQIDNPGVPYADFRALQTKGLDFLSVPEPAHDVA